MVIGSIDLGSNAGWCKWPSYGLQCFTGDQGSKLTKFYSWLSEVFHDVDIVAYEQPVGGHFTGIKSLANFEGVLLLWAKMNNKGVLPVKPSEIKKFATGKGNAKKEQMLKAVNAYSVSVKNHNVADAIHIWHFVNQFAEKE